MSAAISAGTEEKNSVVENATRLQFLENTEKKVGGVKNTVVNFAPITTDLLHTLSLPTLVDRFYELLQQRPSQKKRERAIQQAQKLLDEGFTLQDLDDTVTWVTQKHPDTGSFDRIPFFIDQALKDREIRQQATAIEQQRQATNTQRKMQEQRTKEEGRQLEGIQASLSAETLEGLRQEATQLIAQEHGKVQFGEQTLIRLKMEELIRERYV
jgi:hypothetical protein